MLSFIPKLSIGSELWRFNFALTTVLGLILVFGSQSVWSSQEYYQWEDQNGEVSFGDSPPPDAKNVKKFGSTRPPSYLDRRDGTRAREQQDEMIDNLDDKRKAEEAADNITTAQELLDRQKELDEKRCRGLRANLVRLRQGGRLFTRDPQTGDRSFLEDSEILRQVRVTQDRIAKECSGK